MAELLKQQYDLIVLKVERMQDEDSSSVDRVSMTLQVTSNRARSEWSTSLLADHLALEIPKRRRRGEDTPPGPTLPVTFKHELMTSLQALDVADRTLWVHLVKPYGALRWLAWERELIPFLNMPVLMLPDFIFPPPREATRTLEVALCASAPLGWENATVHQAVNVTIQAALLGSSRRTRVHVFADAALVPALHAQWGSSSLSAQVVVHDPQCAAPFVQTDLGSRVVDQAGLLRSPWLLWMRDALRSRAVDVVHFCCHGHLARDRGAMLFAQSPLDRSDEYLAGPVGAIELQTFMTQIGAWATAFESVPDNHSPEGLRALADEIAQSRPGPMMLHDLGLDPDGDAIAEGYRFLFGSTPGRAPKSPALLLFCQPYLDAPDGAFGVNGVTRGGTKGQEAVDPSRPPVEIEVRNMAQAFQVAAAGRQASTDVLRQAIQNGSPWVSSTERLAEGLQLQYQSLARDGLMSDDVAAQQADLLSDTLQTLRGAVTTLARERGELL
ncbi:MAG: hypothetical protein IPN53_13030 [Comamonadaceae bacterium]|nr:hypothetical protein [Comamonadaceae bacterium]